LHQIFEGTARTVQPRILCSESAARFNALAGAAVEHFHLTIRAAGRVQRCREDHVLVTTAEADLPLLIRRGDEVHVNFGLEMDPGLPFTDSKRPLYTYLPGFNIHTVPEAVRRPISNIAQWLRTARQADSRQSIETRYRRLPLTNFELSILLVRAVLGGTGAEGYGLCRWPGGKRAAFVALHDVDSDGLLQQGENDPLFRIEARHRIRSTWFIPTAVLNRNPGAIGFLRSAGHEVGWHGHQHDHRDHVRPHADRAVQALLSSPLIDETAPPLGMRLPKLLKSNALFQLLGEQCPAMRYDTSFVCGVAPFSLSVNGRRSRLLEIPTTVPTDIRVHNEVLTVPRLRRAAAILRAQIARTEQLISAGGLISIVTHPEKGLSEQPELLDVYDQYLDYVRSRKDVWLATSGELFSHWASGGGDTAPQVQVQ
jgi:peptidoglycan/xylan/chitin deacetylase (PgdA/CDA1 family)